MIPTAEEFAEALAAAKPTPNELAMLQWHYGAPQKTLTAAKLSELMEWGGQSANSHYGKFADRVASFLDWVPNGEDRYWVTMKVSCLVIGSRPADQYEWTLRPQVANALDELGWVQDSQVQAAPADSPSLHPAAEATLPEGRRVWIKSFWGFGTENESYLGFTREADRERFLRLYQEGDLVMIYGAVSNETAEEDRRQILGFLDVEPRRVSDRDRSSPEAFQEKIDNHWEDKWTYAVPVKRAWVVRNRIQVKHVATTTYQYERARAIATQGELLTERESVSALRLPVKQVNVYLEPPVADCKTYVPLGKLLNPARGIPPSFGERTSTTSDGEHFLYMMKLYGNLAPFLGRDSLTLVNKVLVKVGYSNDPLRRWSEMNSGIPGPAIVKWQKPHISNAFPNARAAFDAETTLKAKLASAVESLGGEFFVGRETKIDSVFNDIAMWVAPIIAPPRRNSRDRPA